MRQEESKRVAYPLAQGLTRALTSGLTLGSAIILVAAAIIGFSPNKNASAYKISVYAAILGFMAGGLLGMGSAKSKPSVPHRRHLSDSPDWQDWREFVVTDKVRESQAIASFYLQPVEQGPLPTFQPGQFLTIKLAIPGFVKPIIRTYSLSDDPAVGVYYRLSIKRELAPKGQDLPPGIASNFMHDYIQTGSMILAKPPSGKFVVEPLHTHPIVLISNGVGITPMISMAKACSRLNPDRLVWFLHGARDGQSHAFQTEIKELAAQNSNLRVHIAYSRPRPEDAGVCDSSGYVDLALIRSLISPQVSKAAEFFLCGSPPFMQSLMQGLRELGVADHQIRFEAFTSSSKPSVLASSITTSATDRLGYPNPGMTEVVFAKSGQTAVWRLGESNLLEFAEAHDLQPDYSCRQGICGTCSCKILAGEIDYSEPPTAEVSPGSVLLCIAQPKIGPVVLDL